MANENRSALEFDAVVRRFGESSEALANIRENIQVLSKLQETEEEANTSLQGAAQEIARFANEAATVLKGLEDTQAQVADVLRRGTDLINGTELREIKESLHSNAQSISSVNNRINALDSKLGELIASVAALQTSANENAEAMKQNLQNVHTDVKNPIIVKRFF